LCSTRLHLVKNTVKLEENIILLQFITSLIYSSDDKAEFSALLLQSAMSHDPSEIISNMLISYYLC